MMWWYSKFKKAMQNFINANDSSSKEWRKLSEELRTGGYGYSGKVTPEQACPKAPEPLEMKKKEAKLTIVLLGEDQWISITKDFDTHPKESFKDFFAWYEDDDSKKTFSFVGIDTYYVVSKDKIKYAYVMEVK